MSAVFALNVRCFNFSTKVILILNELESNSFKFQLKALSLFCIMFINKQLLDDTTSHKYI